MNTDLIITCKNCGRSFTGKYCNSCGEKNYDEHDKSIKHLFEEIFHFFTHFDSKFFRTLQLVLFRPGTLSFEYCNGVRKPFFKPVSLFFVCVILYLLFPLFKGLNMQLSTYTQPQYGYTSVAVPIIKQKLQRGFTGKELAEHYNKTSPAFAKVLLLLFLPLSALVLKLLFFKRKRYFFDHFILATELNTFFVFIGFLFLPVFVRGIVKLWPATITAFSDDSVFFRVMLLLYVVAFSVALKKFYKENWGWTIVKSFVFVVLYLFAIRYIYNLILFLLVMLFLHK